MDRRHNRAVAPETVDVPSVKEPRLTVLLTIALPASAGLAMVSVRPFDMSPAHGRVRAGSGAVPTVAFGTSSMAGERLQAVHFSIVGCGPIEPQLEHFLAPNTSWLDKAKRQRKKSGYAIHRCTRDDRFYADSVLPGMNDLPVVLDGVEAIDLSRWPRVRIGLPAKLPDSAGRVRYCVALRTSKAAPHGMRFRVRLEGVDLDRNTPWVSPLATRPLIVDTRPPRVEVKAEPGRRVRPGDSVTFRLTADETLAFAPHLRVQRPDYTPTDLGRGVAMRREGEAFVAAFRPLALLTHNGKVATPPIRYTHYPKPIPRYRDDGRCLINGDCRYSWLAKGAVTWRNTERVEIKFDLGAEHEVETVRTYVSSRMSDVDLAVATSNGPGDLFSEKTTTAIPVFGRGPAFDPPLNIMESHLPPTPARWLRLRLTGQTSLQVTEVEILGDRHRAPVGQYWAHFRVYDQALNQAPDAKVAIEVRPAERR